MNQERSPYAKHGIIFGQEGHSWRTSLEHVLGLELCPPAADREALVLVVKKPERVVPKLLRGVLLLHLVTCSLQHNGKNKIQQHKLQRTNYGGRGGGDDR